MRNLMTTAALLTLLGNPGAMAETIQVVSRPCFWCSHVP
jgi:hypothetical protein